MCQANAKGKSLFNRSWMMSHAAQKQQQQQLEQGMSRQTTSSRNKEGVKQVSFASEATEYLICTKLTPQERNAIWYPPLAFADFKQRNRELGKAVRHRRAALMCDDESNHNYNPHQSSACLDPLNAAQYESEVDVDVTRGIEHFCCAIYFDERKKNKQATVQAVLSEQRKQRYQGILDATAIGEVARFHTNKQRQNALRFGTMDAAKALSGDKQILKRPMSPRSVVVSSFDDSPMEPVSLLAVEVEVEDNCIVSRNPPSRFRLLCGWS